jgi:AcrR family transcriptional regulator
LALVEEGISGVEVNKLANRLRVSRGGFYWFFKNRGQLLDELLGYWIDSSTVLFDRILGNNDSDGLREYRRIIGLWVDEDEYDPKWDGAIRDWARTSPVVRDAVHMVDEKRIAVLEQVFHHLGYSGEHAHVRARVMYYHQVGYYALGVRESKRRRLKLLPFYAKVLAGRDV